MENGSLKELLKGGHGEGLVFSCFQTGARGIGC